MTVAREISVDEAQETSASIEILLQKARALTPILRQRAAVTAQARRVPERLYRISGTRVCGICSSQKNSVGLNCGQTSLFPLPRNWAAAMARRRGSGPCLPSMTSSLPCGQKSFSTNIGQKTRFPHQALRQRARRSPQVAASGLTANGPSAAASIIPIGFCSASSLVRRIADHRCPIFATQ